MKLAQALVRLLLISTVITYEKACLMEWRHRTQQWKVSAWGKAQCTVLGQVNILAICVVGSTNMHIGLEKSCSGRTQSAGSCTYL